MTFITIDSRRKNAGDYIQTLGVEHALRSAFGGVAIERHVRNGLHRVDHGVVVLNAWFEHHGDMGFVPGTDAVWVGCHFTTCVANTLVSGRYGGVIPGSGLGCRDLSTYGSLKGNFDCYFSRCLSVVTPYVSSGGGRKVFMVNVPRWAKKRIPRSVSGAACVIDQKFAGGGFSLADELLRMYRDEASLVVTGALHCALPCAAMGIPVVVFAPECDPAGDPERFSALQGILDVHESDGPAEEVDFAPKPVDLYDLKLLLIRNLEMSVCYRDLNASDVDELRRVRQNIKEFSAS